MCTKELQLIDKTGDVKFIGVGTSLLKEEFQKQPCNVDGLGDVYRAKDKLNKTVWLTQEKQLSVFNHKIENFGKLFIDDLSNEKLPVLNYRSFHDSGLYDPTFIKARNEYIFRYKFRV